MFRPVLSSLVRGNRVSLSVAGDISIPKFTFQQVAGFRWVPPQTTKHSVNLHRSSRNKAGLFHGKDIRSGHSISFSHKRSKRKFLPNAQSKRLFSEALNDWVHFQTTTAGIKSVDDYGGVDNYLLNLDERLVKESQYVTKMRRLISATLFHKGELSEKHIKYLKYDQNPPPIEWTQLTKIGDYYYENTPIVTKKLERKIPAEKKWRAVVKKEGQLLKAARAAASS